MPVQSFVPYLSIKGANKAVEYYSRVFETSPRILQRMPNDCVMHCEFRLGSDDNYTRLFISEELPEHGGTPSPTTVKATTVAIHVYVDDCDKMVASMKEHGGTVLAEPEDLFWGERFARVRDPFGHEWGIATCIKEMTPQEIQDATDKLFKNSSGVNQDGGFEKE